MNTPIPESLVTGSCSVYVLVLSGSNEQAQRIAELSYPGCQTIHLSKRKLREDGWRGQIRQLRKLKGEAFIVFVDSLLELQEPLLLRLTILFHGCRETRIADSEGRVQVFRKTASWKLVPKAIACMVADVAVLLGAWFGLISLRFRARAQQDWGNEPTALDTVFLYPFPMDRAEAGGAMSHVEGFLSGLVNRLASCEIFSGRPLPITFFPVHEYPNRRRWYLFRESQALSYNLQFVDRAEQELGQRRPSFIYQRHGRYVVSGALLSKRLRRPLVLEYNGSEVWIAKHWDPTRFPSWLKLCEEVSLAAASVIVVVSEALRQELIDRDIPEGKILVNPNAVDPVRFCPDCGGKAIRQQLGFHPNHIVAGFIGSFSYWHGIGVLQQAILMLLREQESDSSLPELRFLLIGDGPLGTEMREALKPYTRRGWIVFTGQVPHHRAPAYLDSADILVSPHVPMPDGKPFFGSPTKLFEYLAMGKAIVASNLDQLARVLSHKQTALLVEPGNAVELAHAIRLLSIKPELRGALGKRAREVALAKHTWEQNAARVVAHFVNTEPNVSQLRVVA
jgi:glycosyltransferase involved in cell wall biosynthesis